MLVIRPIEVSDYPALESIARESGIGFTSLPVNERLLRKRIDASELAFSGDFSKKENQSYLFVMEDNETGEVVGTSGIESRVGIDDAFYHYHLGKVVHASQELGIHNTVDILTFCNDYTGVSEICTLFLREQARNGLAGRLLSKFRFLFLAEHHVRFSDVIIAEMRGVSDENGRSPFWEWLEKHFFSLDFPTADYFTGIGNKVFIAELMPKYPIYVNLLSEDAQACIGKVHEKTKPALRLLEQEGFRCRGYVDIFDAGPTVEADLNNIETVRNSRKATIEVVDKIQPSKQEWLIVNTKVREFRACVGQLSVINEDKVQITPQIANALQLERGEKLRYSPLLRKSKQI